MVVVAAVVGGRASGPTDPPAATSNAIALASPAPTPRPAPATLDPSRPRTLVVRGWVARSAGEVHVMVASGTTSPIAVGAIDPTGKPRNGMVPFETTFTLPRVTVDAAGSLYVIATDGLGRPLADGQWQAVQGAIVEMVIR